VGIESFESLSHGEIEEFLFGDFVGVVCGSTVGVDAWVGGAMDFFPQR
jgi:hypothetical protein